MVLAAEQPEQLAGFPGEIEKRTLERLHLERFRFDQILRSGASPFDGVREGADPPDFIVATTETEVRVECVQMALENRRRAHRLFGLLQERLLPGAGDRTFSGLAGSLVEVSFGPRLDELPPRRTDDSLVEPLLDTLAAATIDHEARAAFVAKAASGGLPAQLPPQMLLTWKTPDEAATFFANVVCPPEQARETLGELGFAIRLQMPIQVTASEALGQLERLVAGHDKAGVDFLLITAGGPDRRGMRYPGEEMVAAFILQEEPSVSVHHLKRVTMHLWGACEAHDIPVV